VHGSVVLPRRLSAQQVAAIIKLGTRYADGKHSRRSVGRSSRRVPGTRTRQTPRRKRLIKKLAATVAEKAAKMGHG
jgi:hypothetical protein